MLHVKVEETRSSDSSVIISLNRASKKSKVDVLPVGDLPGELGHRWLLGDPPSPAAAWGVGVGISPTQVYSKRHDWPL
jgi:hypothetical protein